VSLKKQTAPNLELPLGDLVSDGDELTVTDSMWRGVALNATIKFSDEQQ
jgi:E2 binding domain